MPDLTATARSHSNIAFIKYWGNRDAALRIPSNGSLSMNLAGLNTVTTVRFRPDLLADRFILNQAPQTGTAAERVSCHLDLFRTLAGSDLRAEVVSENNFPAGAGIASSASAFSALSLAASAALGLTLDERVLTRLARRGSGSASRSIPGGFVELHAGADDASAYAESIAPPDHWALIDLVTIVSRIHKKVGSSGGHSLAETSPLQPARVADTPRRLDLCRTAILNRDFATLAHVAEHDTLLMHAVMMTSQPALIYWDPPTLAVIDAVRGFREDGIPAFFTIDAGPNVHVITPESHAGEVAEALSRIDGVQTVLSAPPGGPARLQPDHLPSRV
jgi:diphosphomevalonate decarboxylase